MMKFDRGTFGLFPAKFLKGLTPYQQVVFAWLCFHANEDGVCFPSIKTLCLEAKMSNPMMCKTLKELENMGFLSREKRKLNKTNSYTSTVYKITINDVTNTISKGLLIPLARVTNDISKGYSPHLQGVTNDVSTNQKNSNQNKGTCIKQADACSQQQPHCPYEKIVEIYNRYCYPPMPYCQIISETRRKHIRSLWLKAFPKLEDWEKYFKTVSESDFLMGRLDFKDRAPFHCSFDWLLRMGNMLKVMEGNYDNRR